VFGMPPALVVYMTTLKISKKYDFQKTGVNEMVDRAIAELIAVTRSRAASLAKFVA